MQAFESNSISMDRSQSLPTLRLFLAFPASLIIIFFLFRIICLNSHVLMVEEAYYWNYAQHLDFGYLDHPPMVAVLIKISSIFFGVSEFSVRIPALLCWIVTAWFSFKLTQLIQQGAGQYAVFLLSILPYFCMQSLVMTPDLPLLTCWSAVLYYSYRALVLNESFAWYPIGLWLGLGMLSKYTIVLLGPATLLYLALTPHARFWFFRKEPYFAIFIAILLFTPVIYWNASHEWASFVFQSSRRFHSPLVFSFHQFIAILILFLLPTGIVGLIQLYNSKISEPLISKINRRYLQIFTLIPLAFFGFFSLTHRVRLDWIGPGLLALIPWLALSIHHSIKDRKRWAMSSVLLFVCYLSMMLFIRYATPSMLAPKLLGKFIAWDHLSLDINHIASEIEQKTHKVPVIIPLDQYNIGSELSFYQEKLKREGQISTTYPIQGADIFGINSLMFHFWSDPSQLYGKPLILVSNHLHDLDTMDQNPHILKSSKLFKLWSYAQKKPTKISQYFYKIVEVRSQYLIESNIKTII